jgi:hypothetical protein
MDGRHRSHRPGEVAQPVPRRRQCLRQIGESPRPVANCQDSHQFGRNEIHDPDALDNQLAKILSVELGNDPPRPGKQFKATCRLSDPGHEKFAVAT